MDSIEELKEKIRQFNLERDWDKFHNPKDLLVALVSEEEFRFGYIHRKFFGTYGRKARWLSGPKRVSGAC